MPSLASALRKAAIEKRLAEIASVKQIVPGAASGPVIRAARFTPGRWVDVLRLADPTANAVQGTWSRSRAGTSSETGDANVLELPLTIEGAYDLEVNFTRTQGESDVHVVFPVGSHECNAVLGAYAGKVSGLYLFEGHTVDAGPIKTQPGVLENGRRYRLSISVRVPQDNKATIQVSLDGRPYLPDWEGNPESWSVDSAWSSGRSGRVAIGQLRGHVDFHSVRLRMLSGHAALDSAVAAANAATPVARADHAATNPAGPTIIAARWGQGNRWADVTDRVRQAVGEGLDIELNPDFLQSEPAQGTGKNLQVVYKIGGVERAVNYREGGKWAKEDYQAIPAQPRPVARPRLGKSIDLLADIDTERDTTLGNWFQHAGTIVSDGDISRIVFPREVAASSYELRVEFCAIATRTRFGYRFQLPTPVATSVCPSTTASIPAWRSSTGIIVRTIAIRRGARRACWKMGGGMSRAWW